MELHVFIILIVIGIGLISALVVMTTLILVSRNRRNMSAGQDGQQPINPSLPDPRQQASLFNPDEKIRGSHPPPDPTSLAEEFPELEILSLIGQGGMGSVYQVRRRSDQCLMALKIVSGSGPSGDAFATRFLREVEALRRLNHPNIVAIRDHGRTQNWCWLLMDLVDGAHLRQIMATGALSPTQTLALIPSLCAALQYAHDRGVVHRDLKPENILLDQLGKPYLVDFGLAKLNAVGDASLTASGAIMGTMHYMAPEQIERASEVDHRADIYALGVIIYELLTGRLPLGRFEAPSQRIAVDVRIDQVVLRALERDPEKRWQNASDLQQAAENMTRTIEIQERSNNARNHDPAQGISINSRSFGAPTIWATSIIAFITLLYFSFAIPRMISFQIKPPASSKIESEPQSTETSESDIDKKNQDLDVQEEARFRQIMNTLIKMDIAVSDAELARISQAVTAYLNSKPSKEYRIEVEQTWAGRQTRSLSTRKKIQQERDRQEKESKSILASIAALPANSDDRSLTDIRQAVEAYVKSKPPIDCKGRTKIRPRGGAKQGQWRGGVTAAA